MTASENVRWLLEVAVVIAVEVKTFLCAAERIIGRIQIDENVPGRLAMSLKEEIREQPLDGSRLVGELVGAVLSDLRDMFPPVPKRLAGECFTRLVDDGGNCSASRSFRSAAVGRPAHRSR